MTMNYLTTFPALLSSVPRVREPRDFFLSHQFIHPPTFASASRSSIALPCRWCCFCAIHGKARLRKDPRAGPVALSAIAGGDLASIRHHCIIHRPPPPLAAARRLTMPLHRFRKAVHATITAPIYLAFKCRPNSAIALVDVFFEVVLMCDVVLHFQKVRTTSKQKCRENEPIHAMGVTPPPPSARVFSTQRAPNGSKSSRCHLPIGSDRYGWFTTL